MVLPAHGTRYRYNKFECRCPRCRKANAAYHRQWMANGGSTLSAKRARQRAELGTGLGRIDPTRW